MPYIYPELPSYNVMAVFGAALLPFSFKFLLGTLLVIKLRLLKSIRTLTMGKGSSGLY